MDEEISREMMKFIQDHPSCYHVANAGTKWISPIVRK